MEDALKMVISIDQKADEIMKQTQEYLGKREKEIKIKIDAMKAEIMDKTESEAKELYDSIVSEAERDAKDIEEQTAKECGNIESQFIKVKDKLGKKLFSQIFK
ncbi:MAG: hypothetical protein QME45_08615 [Clostridiales bacterium]|nr:hypothetical protein [Clostridiales bacterium]HBM79578.1 hypothetical protein [Clostridiaceae bacterium]